MWGPGKARVQMGWASYFLAHKKKGSARPGLSNSKACKG